MKNDVFCIAVMVWNVPSLTVRDKKTLFVFGRHRLFEMRPDLVPVKALHGLELRALLWEVLVAARKPCDHQNQEVGAHRELKSFGSEE